jgi:DNA-binding PucR family transcriptional regulator
MARELHVHPQTVRYRLAQLRELFGERLDDPDARFELALALRAVGAVSPTERPRAARAASRPR